MSVVHCVQSTRALCDPPRKRVGVLRKSASRLVVVWFAGSCLAGLGSFLRVWVSWRHGGIPRGEHLLGTKWDPGVPCVLVGKA